MTRFDSQRSLMTVSGRAHRLPLWHLVANSMLRQERRRPRTAPLGSGEGSGLLGRPRLAGCEIGVTRFTRRPAMLQAPFLDLTEKHEGRLPSFLVPNHHSEQPDAQFV